jgi:hypothetical protein
MDASNAVAEAQNDAANAATVRRYQRRHVKAGRERTTQGGGINRTGSKLSPQSGLLRKRLKETYSEAR